jgi:putative aldouronate transport system permease protein
VIAVYVYEQGIENAKYSYSTAVSLFNTAINLILLIAVNRIAKKHSDVEFI